MSDPVEAVLPEAPVISEISRDRPNVLLVGTHVSTRRHNFSVSEDLAEQLRQSGRYVVCTSSATTPLGRLADMVSTTWRRREDYDVAQVDVYSGRAFIWAEAVCWTLRRARKPFILTLHGGNLPSFAAVHPARVRRLLRMAAAVTAPSRYLLEQMSPYRSDLEYLPNPVHTSQYHYRLRKRPTPQLLWLRAFHEMYNPLMAPKVIKALVRQHPDIHLTMAGPDKDGSLARTRREAERLGVTGHISFPGGIPHEDVPRWMDRADIFLNTTRVDNTPVSVLEALASGVLVVSTRVGGIPYLLDNGNDALLTPDDDAEAMAAAVLRLLSEPSLPERLSRNGKRKVDAFSWTELLPRWHHLLEETVRNAHAA